MAKHRPSPAMAVAVVALVVALAGTSYAAFRLPKNSVGSKQLKKDAVTNAKVRANAVTGDKVADGSLGGADLADGSVNGSKVADGSLGGADLADGSVALADLGPNSVNSSKVADNSLNGRDIENGTVGSSDVSGLTAGDIQPETFLGATVTVQYEKAATALADGTSASYDVSCLPEEVAIGGGARGDVTDSEYTIVTSSRPLRTGGGFPTDGQGFNGWRATVVNPTGATPGFPASPPDGAIEPEVWAICAKTP